MTNGSNSDGPRKAASVLIGVVIALVEGAVLVSQKLWLYNEAVKVPLIGGMVFGLLVGSTVCFLLASRLKPRELSIATVLIGLGGIVSLYFYYDIVAGERDFPGRGLALFLLSFAVAGCLLFVATLFSIVAVAGQVKKGA